MSADGALVLGVARTPFGRFLGALAGLAPAELGARAVDALLARAGAPASAVSGLLCGTAMVGGATLTVARQMLLQSTLPETTPSIGLDRACCSGMSAVALAAAQISSGADGLIIAGGVEVLSQTPRFLPRVQQRAGDVTVRDPLILEAPFGGTIASYTSEEAIRAGVDRAAQDEWAAESHHRYFAAEADGSFAFERFALPALAADEGPRADCTVAALAALPPVRGSRTITAGNAPGLNDGAAFLLLGSAQAAREHGLEPLGRVVGSIAVAEGPTSGTRTPAIAIGRLLERHGTALDDVAVIEINEAFAATPLVSTLALARGMQVLRPRLRHRTNAHGGAVAIGHPMGASGARLVMTVIARLRRLGGGLGVAAICGGFGQGEAVLIRV